MDGKKIKNQTSKEYRQAMDNYRELITQCSTVYKAFCKDTPPIKGKIKGNKRQLSTTLSTVVDGH